MTHSREQSGLILVVDDFEDNRAMYAEYLTHAGYRVVEAADGREAVARTRELLPDVVVMDLSLPVMDGWAATRELKSDPRTRDVPVIALTGHALAGHSQGAREAGCDEFLAKPCLPATLLATVQGILATRRKEQQPCRAKPRTRVRTR
jgi:two-component system cell cycle response regulator DivK